MPRPKQRTAELRDELLNAALTTLAAGGVGGFTTRKVADAASTSVPALYELFGDRSGLLREVFFAGFRQLGSDLAALPTTNDPRADLVATVWSLRTFGRRNPELVRVMFTRPFADFEPTADDLAAGAVVRQTIVARVRRCIDEGLLEGSPNDIAHVLLALTQGLLTQESGGWLGSPQAVRRRWNLGVSSLLDGFKP